MGVRWLVRRSLSGSLEHAYELLADELLVDDDFAFVLNWIGVVKERRIRGLGVCWGEGDIRKYG